MNAAQSEAMKSPQEEESILVAVDFSQLSEVAVVDTLARASLRGRTSVHFAHVTSSSAPAATEAESPRKQFEVWLSRALAKAGPLAEGTSVAAHLLHGEPAQAVVQLASDLNVDSVVVGTHGRTGLSRLVVGSVAESIVRHCGCTVIVVRSKEHSNAAPQIEPPCPRCVEARAQSGGEQLWCEQHSEKHGRRHTYYNPRSDSWVTHRILS